LDFTKMHGLGNDFIIVNNIERRLADSYFASAAPALCRRRFGIGADGLVVLDPSGHASFAMRIFNPDGSEAEMCGNAIRCLARYVFERGFIKERTFSFETGAGIREVTVLLEGPDVRAVTVDMGRPFLESGDIPVAGPPRRVIEEKLAVNGDELVFTAVGMGNPHCVIFLPSLEQEQCQKWGALIEKNLLFPGRTNVEFVELLSPQEIKVEVWERGAGRTLACGTGACAAVVAGVLTGRLREKVKVHLPGGSLQVDWREREKVFMEGPAVEVFSGTAGHIITREEAGY